MRPDLRKEIIEKYYSPQGLLSAGKFAKKYNYPVDKVRDVLKHTEVYQRTVGKRKKEYYPIQASPRDAEGKNDQYQLDLWDFTASNKGLKNLNGGYRYVLVIVDVWSRFAWTYPIKTKTLAEIYPILVQHVINNPVRNTTQDSEAAWRSPKVVEAFRKMGIKMWFSERGRTATYKSRTFIVERLIRTLRLYAERYKIAFKDKAILKNHLQDLTGAYNNSFHRTLHRTPTEQYNDQVSIAKKKKPPVALKPEDTVRRKKKMGVFTKKSQAPYSKEVYKVGARHGNKFEIKKGDKIIDVVPQYELKKVSAEAFSVRRSNRGRSRMNPANADMALYELPPVIDEIKPSKVFRELPRPIRLRPLRRSRVDYSGYFADGL